MNALDTLSQELRAALQSTLSPQDDARLAAELAAMEPGQVGALVSLAHSSIGDGVVFGDGSISIVIKHDNTALAAVLREALERGRAIHQIAPPPDDFIGRESELNELRDGGVAISGLAGMGGVGKTALALKLAAELKTRYSDADLYLDLQGVGTAPLSVAAALQILIRPFVPPTAQLPDDVATLRGLYLSVLHEQRAVVLLDNAKDAAQVAPLLPPASCAVIVTSRQYFVVAGLIPKRLDTLAPDEACALLLEIAPRIGDCAEEMARLLGYLPLALRLAASALAQRVNLTPQAYLGRLADARTRLGLTDDTALEGPRSIEATMQLSYDLLDGTQQARWRALAVFAGPFDDAAAAALWEIGADAANDALGELCNFSMVEFNEAGGRYRLHDLARDFAEARLSDRERTAAHFAHARHYTAVAWEADTLYKTKGGTAEGLALFDRERAQIEAAYEWLAARTDDASARQMLALVNAVYYTGQELRFHPRQSIAWLESQLGAARRVKHREAEGAALGNLGLAHFNLGDARRAIEYHEQALIVSCEIGDRRGEGNVLGNLGSAYLDLGDARRAIAYYEQALVIDREIGDVRGEGADLLNSALAHDELGHRNEAIARAEAALRIFEAIEDPYAPKVRAKLAQWRGA